MKQLQGYVFTIVVLLIFVGAPPAFAVSGAVPPPMPFVGLDGASSMHGDIASSDTTPLPGPGVYDVDVVSQVFFAACPTVLIRSDGKPFVLSTSMVGRNPVVRLLKQRNGKEKANLTLEAGSLLGGVYACLDNKDRLIMVDGGQRLIRVKAEKKTFWIFWWWELSIDESVSLLSAATGDSGSSDGDAVVSISAEVLNSR